MTLEQPKRTDKWIGDIFVCVVSCHATSFHIPHYVVYLSVGDRVLVTGEIEPYTKNIGLLAIGQNEKVWMDPVRLAHFFRDSNGAHLFLEDAT